jgi:hypothetical protein
MPKVVCERFRRDNATFPKLVWELEDTLSEDLLRAFEHDWPDDIQSRQYVGGRTHRNFTRDGKHRLHRFVREYATLDELVDVIRLLRALRDYLRLQADHIIC